MARILVGVAWLWGAASFFVAPASSVSGAGRIVFSLLVITHALECLIFLPRLRRAGGSLPGHLLRTLLFGFFHVRELPKRRD